MKEKPLPKPSSVIKWAEPRKRNKIPPKWRGSIAGPASNHFVILTRKLYNQKITIYVKINDPDNYNLNFFIDDQTKLNIFQSAPSPNTLKDSRDVCSEDRLALDFKDFEEMCEAIKEARDYLALIKL